jgi:hypothetical protein
MGGSSPALPDQQAKESVRTWFVRQGLLQHLDERRGVLQQQHVDAVRVGEGEPTVRPPLNTRCSACQAASLC